MNAPKTSAAATISKWLLVLLPLAYLWFRLINNLRLEWTTDPQYGYGLLVPFLCIGLLIRRWHASKETGDGSGERAAEKAESRKQKAEIQIEEEIGKKEMRSEERAPGNRFLLSVFPISAFALAFLYLPTRLVEAAVPEWRPIQWSLGVIAIGLTLCVIYAGLGRGWLKQLAFPICFFFVAIPWPTIFEIPLIQELTRASAAMVVELLGWLDVPAVAHGNVIEVGSGWVGIDEACSGIRSFQSSLMISLFLGEFYRLSTGRRWLLVPLGFAFSIAFNVCRMSLLTLIAAKKGVAAISEYHDPAGVTIAILCTLTLWGLAVVLRKAESRKHPPALRFGAAGKAEIGREAEAATEAEIGKASAVASSFAPSSAKATAGRPMLRRTGKAMGDRESGNYFSISAFQSFSILKGFAIPLLIWLCVVEAGVQLWYRSREAHLKPGPLWTLTFPRDNPSLRDVPIDAKTRYLLRFDEGRQADWTESDGTVWDASYFSWLPGRVAGYLAKRHTPEICLTATGFKLLSGPDLTMMNVHGVNLPIRSYRFQTDNGVAQVFHCRWEAGAQTDAYVIHESGRFNLIRAIWEGRGDKGQKVLEFVIVGMNDPDQAKQAVARELDKLIEVKR